MVSRLTLAWMSVIAGLAQPFPSTCSGGRQLPFAAIEVPHPLDKSCGVKGKATSPAPTQLQNTVKNNYCAQGTPQVFTPQNLIDLQHRTTVPSGQGLEPANRKALIALGEGKLITLKAMIFEAHHADLNGGESVNCNISNEEGNDIHIALVPPAATQECASVTAEISPHFRPATWNEIGHFEIFDPATNKYTVNPAVASLLRGHIFRFTGQLFFDASHKPCPCGTNCTPVRSSEWEIHPVTAIDVCKPGTLCNETSSTDWEPFDTWWKRLHQVPPPQSHETPPH
jgi:hypothetical protein